MNMLPKTAGYSTPMMLSPTSFVKRYRPEAERDRHSLLNFDLLTFDLDRGIGGVLAVVRGGGLAASLRSRRRR